LERIYVSLKVGEYTPVEHVSDRPELAPSEELHTPVDVGRTVEVSQALTRLRRLVVLGDPGSGKTTLLKYLVLQLAQRAPSLAPFARSLIPTPLTRILEPLCHFLSGANVWIPGFFRLPIRFPISMRAHKTFCWVLSTRHSLDIC
jgi:hypothetical protein